MMRSACTVAVLVSALLALTAYPVSASLESVDSRPPLSSENSAQVELEALLSDPDGISRISAANAESLAFRLDAAGKTHQAQSLRRIIISRDSMLAARAAEKVLLLLQTDPETIAAGLLGTQAEGMLLTLGSSATGKIRDYLQKKATALQASGLSESHARLTAVVAAINTIGSPELRLVLMNALCHTVDPTLKDASRQLREARSRELTFLRQRGIDETVISSDFAVVRMGTVLGTETDGRLQIQLVAELPLGGEVRRSQAAVTEPAELWRLFVR